MLTRPCEVRGERPASLRYGHRPPASRSGSRSDESIDAVTAVGTGQNSAPLLLADAVLITRPEPGASETAARVSAMGLTPIIAPFLEIRPVPVRLPPPQSIAAVLFASGNAVGAIPVQYHG